MIFDSPTPAPGGGRAHGDENPEAHARCLEGAAEVDVAIVGAGPAGLAAALTLHRHAPQRSLLVLAGPRGAERKIGETLPPGSQNALRALGVWEAFLATRPLPAHGTCSAWGSAELEQNEFIFHPDRRGWHIERPAFDAMLAAEAAKRGIAIAPAATLLTVARLEDRWHLGVRDAESSEKIIRARFVIDASGRAAQFASRLGVRRQSDDRLVAISVSHRLSEQQPMRDTYAAIEARPEGWWYSSLQPNGRLTVACFTDADLALALRLKDTAVWRSHAAQAPHTFSRLSPGIAEHAPQLRLADSVMLQQVTGMDWLAAGDAASTFDPLSSQGILKALRHGQIAAYATLDHLGSDATSLPKYAALLRREYDEFLAAKREHYSREMRWPDAPFWQRRQSLAAMARSIA